MAAQLTRIDAVDESLPSLLDVTPAVLLTVPHVFAVVCDVRCTVSLAPLARSPMLQVSTPALMEQVAAAVPPFTLHDSPGGVRSEERRVGKACAAPAPALDTVSVKPMVSPALTGVASAGLRM